MLRFVDNQTGQIVWEKTETGETFYLAPGWDEQMATREWENKHLDATQLGHDEELRHKALIILKRALNGEQRENEWVIVLPSAVQISWLTESGKQSYVTDLFPSNFHVPFIVDN